jgi:hypothetical protein
MPVDQRKRHSGAVDTDPRSSAWFTRIQDCQPSPRVDLRRQRRPTRDKFVPIHCQDEAIGPRDETHTAHNKNLTSARISRCCGGGRARRLVWQRPKETRPSVSVRLLVLRSISGLRELALLSVTGLTTGETLIRKRMAEAPLLITLPLGKQMRRPIRGMSAPPILRTDGEDKLPLLEQNAVRFAQ